MKSMLTLIVNVFCVIQISNTQLDCSNETALDEPSKSFCKSNYVTRVVERSIRYIENVTTKSVQSGCGLRNVGGLNMGVAMVSASAPASINADEAEFGEFPFTVAIMDDSLNRVICGGSIIHPKAVLTAFHNLAIYGIKPPDLKVRAGDWDLRSTAERLPYQERTIFRIIGHPDYNARLGHIDDVAIVELTDALVLDAHIGTVCLPPADFVPYQQDCFANGWGKDSTNFVEIKRKVMKRVPLGIVESSKCEQALQSTRLGRSFRLDNTFICAGGVNGVDTCQGDGGAPLICPYQNQRPDENRYIQNGIVSWGIGCNEAIPAVYTNVAVVRQWIDETMQFIGLETSTYIAPNNS